MTIRRPYLLLTLLATAACGDSSTGVEDIASIDISPASPSTEVGLTVQFQARALDASGTVVQGATITWKTSSPSVASITTGGLATGLSVGTTSITASAGTASASEPLVVQPSQCTGRIDVILDPGQFQSYAGDTCLLLPSGTSGDRYRVAVVRPTLIEDPADTSSVALSINPILVSAQSQGVQPVAAEPRSYSAGPALADAGPLLDGSRFVEEMAIRNRTRRFHMELRQREIDLGLSHQALLPSRPPPTSGPMLAGHPAPPARADMYLGLTCESSATTSPVILVNFNDDVAIYQDSVQRDSIPLSQAATDQMLSFYSSYVRDFTVQYWGDTPDTDGNGRVILTTSPALADSAAAAVYSGDFHPNGPPPNGCQGSNEGEVMYFSAGVINRLDATKPSYLALSVMAHEVKHVTSLYNSEARGAFHPIWIEEGTAEISQTMSSRIAWAAVGGPAIGARITGNDIIQAVRNNQDQILPEMSGLVGEIADLIVHLSTQPNSLITNPSGASPFHTFYAGAWQWHRFLGDAYGNASTPFADGPLFREITDSLTPAGTAAHARVTGRSFNELFEELVVAMSLHSGLQPEPTRSFTTWDFVSVGSIFASPAAVAPPGDYPWPVTMDLSGNPNAGFTAGVYSCPPKVVNDTYVLPSEGDRCPMGPSGIRFHDFVSSGTGVGAQILVTGAASGKIIVTRLR